MIKSIIAFVVILILSFSSAIGQSNKLIAGIEFGPSLSLLYGSDNLLGSTDPKISFSSGFNVTYKFPKLLALSLSATFERKGAKSTFDVTDNLGNAIGTVKYQHNFDYISLPVLAKLRLNQEDKISLNFGPFFGILLQQKTVIQELGIFPKQVVDQTHLYRRLDIGVSAGLSLNFPVKEKLSIDFEFRNNFGIYNISNTVSGFNEKIATFSSNALIGVKYRIVSRKDN